MYLTYAEYSTGGGSLVTETEFPRYEFLAESLLNWYTFNRLKDETTQTSTIKNLMIVLVDMLKQKANAMSLGADTTDTSGGFVTSQSNDGVSISYNGMNSADLYNIMKDECGDLIKQQLYGVTNTAGYKLLYRGLYPGE